MRWLVGAVVGASVVVAACGGSGGEPTATATSVATASPTAEAPPTDEPTSGASPTATPWDDYVEVVEGEPVPLPEGVVLYYYGYVFTEGIPVDRWLRAHQTSEGLVVRDLAPDVPENSNGGYQFLDDVATGHLSARLCVQGYCGGHADPSPDAREETYESVDGGVTWGPILSPPRGTYIEGARADGNLVAFSTNGSGAISEWFTWPDMEPVSPPGPNLRALMIGGRLLWRSISTDFPMDGGTFYDEQGELVAAPIERPIPGTYDFQRRAVLNLVTWNPSPRDGGVTGYLSEVAPDGAILRSVRYQGYDVSPIAWIDDDRVVVLRYYPRDESIGAAYIVNLETGEMNEIDGLRPTDQDRDSYVTALMTGEFAMVVAPGSCLHVRAAASADSASRECFADGVLFEVTGAGMDDANRAEWLPVRAPGGIEGFASTEFLTR